MAAPIKVTGVYGAVAVAPHAGTTRWTYTVPAGRYCIVENMRATALREAVAAPVGRAGASVLYTPAGGAAQAVCSAEHISNAVGDRAQEIWGGSMLMHAGDALSGFTVDGSTGGTQRYLAAFVGSEFDA